MQTNATIHLNLIRKNIIKFTPLLFVFTSLAIHSTGYAQDSKDINKVALQVKDVDRFIKIQLESLAETKLLATQVEASDLKVDSIFNHIVKEYAKDTLFVTRLTDSQKIWKMLKQANIKALYPNEEPNYYGQVNSDCIYMRLLADNKDRLNFLEKWLIGIPEGDVCAGSIKVIR